MKKGQFPGKLLPHTASGIRQDPLAEQTPVSGTSGIVFMEQRGMMFLRQVSDEIPLGRLPRMIQSTPRLPQRVLKSRSLGCCIVPYERCSLVYLVETNEGSDLPPLTATPSVMNGSNRCSPGYSQHCIVVLYMSSKYRICI